MANMKSSLVAGGFQPPSPPRRLLTSSEISPEEITVVRTLGHLAAWGILKNQAVG
jgi:hypothetical protein